MNEPKPEDKFVPTPRSEAGQKRFDEKQREVAAKAAAEAMAEASTDVEEVMRLLTQRWTEKGFTPEQIVWCIALTTINWRETFPDKHGGKETFDRICREAKAYYDANT